MTQDEAIARLKAMNRAQVARDTRLDYMWLSRLVRGKIKNPRAKNLDTLRDYLAQQDGRQ
jgi:hypothetical protein